MALADTTATDIIAELLQVPGEKLQAALIQRTMSSGGARRGSVYKINLKMPEALATKDALAKGMYVKLFRWLVQKITENMAATSHGKIALPVYCGSRVHVTAPTTPSRTPTKSLSGTAAR